MNKIVIIEDERLLNELCCKVFRTHGFRVLSAWDGVEGIKTIKQEPVDVVLLGILIPRMDGFEVLRRMQRNERMRDIPVVILTHLSHEDDVRRCKELGAQDFCVKALFEPKEIVKKVNALLKNKKTPSPSI